MFILARRLGGLDRSDVKIITCGVMCAALSCSARLNSRALTITPPWSVNKLDPSKHKRENYESHSKIGLFKISTLYDKSLKLLVSQATFLDRGLKTRYGQSQSDPFTNCRECPERRGAKGDIRSEGNFLY